jgi:hypothetical protein
MGTKLKRALTIWQLTFRDHAPTSNIEENRLPSIDRINLMEQIWEHTSSVAATAQSPVPLALKLAIQVAAICPIFFCNGFI